MLSRLCRLSSLALLAAGISSASLISVVDVQLGAWDGTEFTTTGYEWNTSVSGNWAVGITNPELGAGLLNHSMTSDLGLDFGHYYLYLADAGATDTALQISLTFEGGGSDVAVFTSSDAVNAPGSDTRVSGSDITANLLLAPQSTYQLVGEGQRYYADGTPNWVLDAMFVPEPGTWLLLAAGLGVLFAARRYRCRQEA